MAAIWKGGINFGLVHIPVSLYSAESRDEIDLTLLDSKDHARVRYKRVNESTGKEVPWDSIVKGYEVDDGDYIVIEEEDFKRARQESSQNVEIENFVERSEIAPAYFEKPYFLVPAKTGVKGYVLLRETLKRSGKVAIAKVTIRTKEYLSAVMAEGKAMMLLLLRYHHELKNPAEFEFPKESPKDLRITEKELELAERLVKDMTSEWEPEKYHDAYHDALNRIIEEKAEHKKPAPKAAKQSRAQTPGKVIDIMELLRKSVDETGKRRTPTPKRRSGKSKRKPHSRRRVA